MKRLLFLTALIATLLAAPAAAAVGDADTIYVVREAGKVDIFPVRLLSGIEESDEALRLTALDGTVFTYQLADILHYDHPLQMVLPSITSFKFNNKFNHQLFADAEFEITGDSIISGQMACIGHWATPSIKVSDKRAQVVLDDSERITSKRSRLKFGAEHKLTIGYPDINILKQRLVQDAVPPQHGESTTKVQLTADMLSTNAPSNFGEDPGNMLDGNVNTFFHSTWGTGAYEKLPADVNPYFDVHLPEPVHDIQFRYCNRSSEGRHTTGLALHASTDGETWTLVRSFTIDEDNLPSAPLAYYTSPTIKLGGDYTYLRFEQTACYYHNNYLCWPEFELYTVSYTDDEGQDAEYAYELTPYGRTYDLKIDWPADRTTAVPTVRIDIDNNEYVSSKAYYLEANISMDGAGLYPSMETTRVSIKGRGNSSWNSNPYSKNPYRLKFDAKVKPFGLHGGKSWVLLANRQSGSMLSNAIGMYAAGLIGTEGANHIVPVELYMNGEYWGSYNLTEKVGFANNSIDIADESRATMLELDTYYDETYKFRSSNYNLPVNIKEPDFSDPTSTEITQTDIQTRFNKLMRLVAQQTDISPEIDVETLARFFAANELICNYELMHPKSTFLYHEDVTADTCLFKWGPVWDLDWSYGYETSHSYYASGATDNYWSRVSMEASSFMTRLRRCGEPLDRAIYKAYTLLVRYYLDDLVDYVADYYSHAHTSLEHNAQIYYDRDYTNYATNAANAQRWLRQRAQYILVQQTPYELTDEELNLPGDDDDSPAEDFLPYTDDVRTSHAPATRFDVYSINGAKLKAGANYQNLRNGLAPGLYIVNGRKMLIK